MSFQIDKLFAKYNIKTADILYITRNSQRTYIQMADGTCHETAVPVKTIFAELPSNAFWSIQKGILVAKHHVVNVDPAGNYTMVDGTVFEGRHRTPGEHKLHRLEILREFRSDSPAENALAACTPALSLKERCSLMEDAPIAFCVIELVFNGDGHSIDFVFRYCNKEMALLEGVPISEMLNRSFYEVFPNGDKKWIIPYAEVALNGKPQIIRDYSPEIGKNLTIRCFQPMKGYCACFLTTD